jgi:uncharacterized protein YbjT (DUF2867 family)
MAKTILVTGATGTVGAQVLRELTGKEGIKIVAAVRDLARAGSVAGPNVEAVLFDYDKPETLAPACAGVDAIFMVAPFTPNGVEQSKVLIDTAKKAGVKQIVKLGVIRTVGDITIGRWHAAIDEALKSSGIAWTILLPGPFMQNFVETSAPRPDGNIYAPVGKAKASFIDVRDIAAVAAKALTEPGHEGKEYTLTGRQELDYEEIADMISHFAGRKITYVDVPEAAARQGMLAAKMPEWMVNVIIELNAWSKANGGSEITTTVQDVLGRAPKTFYQFAQDYAGYWKA